MATIRPEVAGRFPDCRLRPVYEWPTIRPLAQINATASGRSKQKLSASPRYQSAMSIRNGLTAFRFRGKVMVYSRQRYGLSHTEANAYPFHVVAPQLDERTAVTSGYANAEHAKRGCDHRGASVLLLVFTASANEQPTWPAYCSRSAVFRQYSSWTPPARSRRPA
jgi:hypothetical protein